MKVAVLHNAVPDDAPPDDQDTLVQVEAVAAALRRLGHSPVATACTLDLESMRRELLRLLPDVVFNLVEGLAGFDALLYLPLAVLEAIDIPYAGNRMEAIFATTHKLLAKERMRRAGLPTPDWVECDLPSRGAKSQPSAVENVGDPVKSGHSWIIKSVWEHGSRGMGDDAVLREAGAEELQRRLAERVRRSGRPCFAERFIDGREFVVAMLDGPNGPETLPPAEIEFTSFPTDKPKIVGYRAKWHEGDFEYGHTPRRFDFPASDGSLLDRLRGLAVECWTQFKLRGWARVDFRVDAAGGPWILEINANPCISPDSGFAAGLARASIPYDEAIQRILSSLA